VISPTRELNDRLERLVAARPDMSVEDVWRLYPETQAVPRLFLSELIVRVSQRSKSVPNH